MSPLETGTRSDWSMPPTYHRDRVAARNCMLKDEE